MPSLPPDSFCNAININYGTANQTLTILHCKQSLSLCRQHVATLQQQVLDKDKIIQLLENQLKLTSL